MGLFSGAWDAVQKVGSALASPVTAVTGAVNSYLNYKSQKEQLAYQKDIDSKNFAMQQQQFDYQKNFDATKNQVQAADMASAGINPISGASGASGTSASMSNVSSGTSAPQIDNQGLSSLQEIAQIISSEGMQDKDLENQQNMQDKALKLSWEELHQKIKQANLDRKHQLNIHNDQMKLQNAQLNLDTMASVQSIMPYCSSREQASRILGFDIPQDMYDAARNMLIANSNAAQSNSKIVGRQNQYESETGIPISAQTNTTKNVANAKHYIDTLDDSEPKGELQKALDVFDEYCQNVEPGYFSNINYSDLIDEVKRRGIDLSWFDCIKLFNAYMFKGIK